MQEDPGSVIRVTAPMRSLAQRFSFILMLGMAIGLLTLGRTDPEIFDETRMVIIDSTTPVLDVLSRPIAFANSAIAESRALLNLRQVNETLEAENARLKQWQHAARSLLAENKQLRDLLNFSDDPPVHWVAGRVIGNSSGPFIRSLLVNTGTQDGVARGHAAMSSEGLLGRVASIGEKSARILLINDLNSRIPVVIESNRARAVLAGDNSRRPRLTFLSTSAEVTVGSRIVTSGHGGVFPTGLPIGIISEIGSNGIRIEPFASPDRLEFVKLINFGLAGVIDIKGGFNKRVPGITK